MVSSNHPVHETRARVAENFDIAGQKNHKATFNNHVL